MAYRVFKQEEEIFECLAQEEAFHFVAKLRRDLLDVLQRRVPARIHPAVLFKRLANEEYTTR